MKENSPTLISLPESSGNVDRDYLSSALQRAGIKVPEGAISTEELLGGRTGATVIRLLSGKSSFVLKFIQEDSWRIMGLGDNAGGEANLWTEGITQNLSGPIFCPVIDISYAPGQGQYLMLMQDVGKGFRDRGKFSRADTRSLFHALAQMQAPYYENEALNTARLPKVSDVTRLLSKPVLHLSGKRPSDEKWVHDLIGDFKVVSAFLPVFLELLGPSLADAYLNLLADDLWIERLNQLPFTLLHGDLRRANITFIEDTIPIVDWEFAAKGPPGCDLQWHCFLHYWGYPPDGAKAGDDCDDLRDEYIKSLESALGRSIDQEKFLEGWNSGWIKVMAQLGYALVDPLFPDGGSAETRREIQTLCCRAVQRALDFRDSIS